MDKDGFKFCCPSCHSDDFQPLEMQKAELQDESAETYKLVLSSSYHDELHHCNHCGHVFETGQAIELRLLEPVEV